MLLYPNLIWGWIMAMAAIFFVVLFALAFVCMVESR
jgi:hypothetical protein